MLSGYSVDEGEAERGLLEKELREERNEFCRILNVFTTLVLA